MKLSEASWIFLDTETTGLKPEEGAKIIDLGLVFVRGLRIGYTKNFLINPGHPIPPEITKLTGITNAEEAARFVDRTNQSVFDQQISGGL